MSATESTDMFMWLSFAGDEGSNGACIVTISAEEIAAAKEDIDVMFPMHAPGAEVVAAATRKAHKLGCNPGGQVMSMELDAAKIPPNSPIGKLMHRAEWEKIMELEGSKE